MCSWTSPSTGKLRTKRGEPSGEATEEDDELEDQVVYRYDLPNELLGLYQQGHQLNLTPGPSHVSTKAKKRLQETSTKVLVPPSAVEEAAWASLTQADNHWRISSQRPQAQELNEANHGHSDSTEGYQAAITTADRPPTVGIQTGSHGKGPPTVGWAEALEQLIGQEVQRDVKRAPVSLQTARPGDALEEVDLAEKTFDLVEHGPRTAGQSSEFQPERKSDIFGFPKGKQKQHPGERFRINNLKVPQPYLKEGAPVPLAQRLQELVEEDSPHSSEPRQAGRISYSNSELRQTGGSIAEKLQSLIESSVSSRGCHQQSKGKKVSRQFPSFARRSASTVLNIGSAIQDDIVDCPDPDADDSGVQGSSRYVENNVQIGRSVRNLKSRQRFTRSEPLEDIDNDEDFFDLETSAPNCISVATSTAPTNILERFRDALLSAPPEVISIDSCGLSARLNAVLSAQKSKHMHFTKLLQRKPQDGNLGQCLEVVILETIEEAQLTTCRCEVILSPEIWNHERRPQNVCTENALNASIIDVMFSKISSGVESHVGRLVRIHPPWQEVPRATQSARLIVSTFFCEVLN